jgi:hypothetical protein
MLVLRVNGNEPYVKVKVSEKIAKQMENEGHFTNYNSTFGYIEGDYPSSQFTFKKNKYKIEFFSGCFYPFLLKLN